MLYKKSFLPSLPHLLLGILSFTSTLTIVNDLPALAMENNVHTDEQQLSAQTSLKNQLPNGTYLYGSSPHTEQLGKEYMVFKVEEGEVKGAVYFPQSEFSCFTGVFADNNLHMSIIDPYDGKKYPYSVSLQIPPTVASQGTWSDIGLEGYYRLNTITSNDQRILDTCL